MLRRLFVDGHLQIVHEPLAGITRNVVVCTAHDPPYADLAAVTFPSLKRYCEQHGYALAYDSNIPDTEKDLCKFRIFRELKATGRYRPDDLFLWLDTDAAIINPNIRVEDIWHTFADETIHFLWSYNWDGPNSGVFIMRFSDAAEQFSRVVAYEQDGMGWGDNNAMNQKSLYPPFSAIIRCVPGRVMNAAPYELYGLEHRTDKDEINNYSPGDWIIHLPGMENSKRIRVFAHLLTPMHPAC